MKRRSFIVSASAAAVAPFAAVAAAEHHTSAFALYLVDECMYVAARSPAEAMKHVQEECGGGSGTQISPVPLEVIVETANVENGEESTPESRQTARAVIDEALRFGQPLPFTVAYSADY